MAIFMDNASTSFPKPREVSESVVNFIKDIGAIPSSSYNSHQALLSRDIIEKCKNELSSLLGVTSQGLIMLTTGATEALDRVIRTMQIGDKIVISKTDPLPVTRAAKELKKEGVLVVEIDFDPQKGVNMKQLEKTLQESKMLVLSHASNITGVIIPAEEIAKMCKKFGVTFVLDVSHTIGVFPINVNQLGADIVIFSGHKHLMGPTGTGGVYMSDTYVDELRKLKGRDVKDLIEFGTPNIAGFAGLLAGVKLVEAEKVTRMRQHNRSLRESLLGALEMCKGLKILAPDVADGVCIVSFVVPGLLPNTAARLLEERYGCIVGNGLMNNAGTHEILGTSPHGCLRASMGFFNTISDIEYLGTSLSRILNGR